MNKKIIYHTFYAKDGQSIYVRPLEPRDTPLLVDIFNHMSAESRYRRFHQTLDHVPESRVWQEATQISHFDPSKSFGFIAFATRPGTEDVPVGVARYIDTGPGEAEVAISVRDDFQNLGVGKKIMRLLADEAKKRGYRRLIASIQNDNVAVWRVFQHLPYHIFRTPDGTYANIIIILSTSPIDTTDDGCPKPILNQT